MRCRPPCRLRCWRPASTREASSKRSARATSSRRLRRWTRRRRGRIWGPGQRMRLGQRPRRPWSVKVLGATAEHSHCDAAGNGWHCRGFLDQNKTFVFRSKTPSSGQPPTAVGYPPTAIGYPPTAIGYPLTAVGYPLTAVGYPPTGKRRRNGQGVFFSLKTPPVTTLDHVSS